MKAPSLDIHDRYEASIGAGGAKIVIEIHGVMVREPLDDDGKVMQTIREAVEYLLPAGVRIREIVKRQAKGE